MDNEDLGHSWHTFESHRFAGRGSRLPTQTIAYLNRSALALTAVQLGGSGNVPSLPLADSLQMYFEDLHRFAYQVEIHVDPLTTET